MGDANRVMLQKYTKVSKNQSVSHKKETIRKGFN